MGKRSHLGDGLLMAAMHHAILIIQDSRHRPENALKNA